MADWLGEEQGLIHEQMEPQAKRIKEYGTAGRYKNYSDIMTGVGGKGRSEKPGPTLNEVDID